ncbi:type I-B CRISPR-associated protein Cas5 [Acidilutibacter cellobiosedens]|jgi:CRISPR-associated protein Cas5h|uniref:Type I-B CRISPR-associated protein Cas5 n=1 Tax=Acidilutibacter cellobiosedens TaxID=2507161 RepID=A0A410QCZ8_9FIRM|nr:type I-B CRISPR-associated protein Cas5b [Acidilutibacter cellobiosedens]QAT61866.1 type I-B CRISPR-associated protein Cas5 [Acidilutibacter cellobiosedens]
MKGVVFDIEGKFAHFRKFYTNSSSLSYSLPPRTTVEGLIASILGYERDSYYKVLSSNKLHIAVKKNGPTRSLTQTLNYIKATSASQLCFPDEHTQIPFEIITGCNDDSIVSYRIYAASEEGFMEELQERLIKNKFAYPPCMGTVFFQGDIENVQRCEIYSEKSNEYVPISSVVPSEKIENIKIENYQLVKERMPRDFDENREIKKSGTYIFDHRGVKIDLKLKNDYYVVKSGEESYKSENILFM